MAAAGKTKAIGIDLGTTYSCVAVWESDGVEVIANDHGNRTTPSYVAFSDTTTLVGDAARNQFIINPQNTVFDSKRLIGRRFSSEAVQSKKKLWQFQVVPDAEDKPEIMLQINGEEKRFSPEEISAMILKKMKEIAAAFLGRPVANAVVTVPAHFNDAQRQATKAAGVIAGLNVLQIINEPTAAAIAYGIQMEWCKSGKQNVLIFDLGGGTLDVSLVTIGEGIFEVNATAGDPHLGGEDFDDRLVRHFVEQFEQKHGKDLTANGKALRRLRTACEKAKRALSFSLQTVVEIELIHEDMDCIITRSMFEELCMDLFQKCLDPVKNCLLDAQIDKTIVDEIVLVGGSSRIPKIQELLKEFFNGKELNKSINCDEAVAYGAAVHAAVVNGDGSPKLKGLIVHDVTALSLGVESVGGIMNFIVPRNTPIPTKMEKRFQTAFDNQTTMCFAIYEGERSRTRTNNHIGFFKLKGIPRAPAGVSKITLSFHLNRDGILNVSADCPTAGVKNSLTITKDSQCRSKEEARRMVKDAENGKVYDDFVNDMIENVKNYAHDLIKDSKLLDLERKRTIRKAVNITLRFLDKDQLAVEVNEVETMFAELQMLRNSLLN